MRNPLHALFLLLALAACGGATAVPLPAPRPEPPPQEPAEPPPTEPPSPTCGQVPTIEDGLEPTALIHVAPAPEGSDASGDGTDTAPFQTVGRALQDVRPGEAVRLHPGTYAGTLWIEDLEGEAGRPIWIGGMPGQAKPTIQGGTEGIHLIRPTFVILHDLEVTGALANGINCDDGGDRDDTHAAHDLLFRDLDIHDIGEGGNHDGLKLSGLNRYVVRTSTFKTIRAGSGIDHVGCHDGVIHDCTFEAMGSNAIQCKGGTENLLITRCTFNDAGARGVNIGGSTGFAYFRPPLSPTEANAEARDVRVIANVFGECTTPFAFVGAVDCVAANNTIRGATYRWLFRILQETTSQDGFTFLETQRCQVVNNLFHFQRATLSTFVNIGPDTQGDTYVIRTNLWFAADDPDGATPTGLPVEETGEVVGQDPFPDPALAPRITAASPAAGAGTALGTTPADADGRCYASPPSIGAYAAR